MRRKNSPFIILLNRWDMI